MKITVLNEKGHEVLTTEPITVEEARTEEIKKMSSDEIKKEFNRLITAGYTAVNDKTNRVIEKFDSKIEDITMLYPTVRG